MKLQSTTQEGHYHPSHNILIPVYEIGQPTTFKEYLIADLV